MLGVGCWVAYPFSLIPYPFALCLFGEQACQSEHTEAAAARAQHVASGKKGGLLIVPGVGLFHVEAALLYLLLSG